MKIAFIDPLSRGWDRMTNALFKPFDLVKWLVVGFTAFLAGLTDYHGGNNSKSDVGYHDGRLEDIVDYPYIAWNWLLDHPGWFVLIIFGIIFLTVLGILLTWLSSRGKFMFLDNVVHNRANVAQPWHDFKSLGNSLFIWRFFFGLIALAIIIGFLIVFYILIRNVYEDYYTTFQIVIAIVGLILVALSLFITIGFISLFLNDFVVPVMYKKAIKILPAWGIFLSLFSKHILHFILYGIIVFFLHIFIFILVVMAGLMTCCVGFIFLIIPYISSVITLPISYTFRAFSVEFLEQFGDEFKIFPQKEDMIPAEHA